MLEGNDKMIGYSGVLDALTIDENNKLRREVRQLKRKETDYSGISAQIRELQKLMGISPNGW